MSDVTQADTDDQREAELFARMDQWGEAMNFQVHEDMRFLRRRLEEAREELAFWRNDALARLQMATWLHNGLMQNGKEDRAAQVRVSTIMPTLAAMASADARDFYERCALCGKAIKPSDLVTQVAIGDPEDNSMVCAEHGEPAHAYVHKEDPPDAIIAAAKATLRDDEPSNSCAEPGGDSSGRSPRGRGAGDDL